MVIVKVTVKAGTCELHVPGAFGAVHALVLDAMGITDAGPVRTKAEADQVEAEARRRYEAAQPRPSRARAR